MINKWLLVCLCFIGTGLAILKLLSGYAETEQISHLELDFSLEKKAAKTERELGWSWKDQYELTVNTQRDRCRNING